METKNRAKIGNKLTDVFWTKEKVWSGVSLPNSMLFTILIVNLENILRKKQWEVRAKKNVGV